jgi:hypothetical protein
MVEALNFLPLKQNISIKKGATLNIKFSLYNEDVINRTINLLDLTGYSFTLLVRDRSSGATILTASTDNGRITIATTVPTLTILVSATDMNALTAGDYEYYLRGTDTGGVVFDVLEGNFLLEVL